MGEFHHEKKKKYFNPPYSARLLWNVLSQTQTKIIVSVLKAEQGVRRRISVRSTSTRTRTREWVENEGYILDSQTERKVECSRESRRKSVKRFRGSCYLCQLEQKSASASSLSTLGLLSLQPISPPSSSHSHSDPESSFDIEREQEQERIIYLPITRSQPPRPPRRSTSLPYYKILKQVNRIRHLPSHSPQYPLSAFTLPRNRNGNMNARYGFVFRYLVERICTPQFMPGQSGCSHGEILQNEIWKTILQVAHREIGILHLLLGVGYLHLPYSNLSSASSSWHPPLPSKHPLQQKHKPISKYRHCFNALLLSTSETKSTPLSQPRTPNPQIYEMAFISLYLLTYTSLLLKKPKIAGYYHRVAFLVLKKALGIFDTCAGEEGSGDGEGKELPGCMRGVAGAFGRLGI